MRLRAQCCSIFKNEIKILINYTNFNLPAPSMTNLISIQNGMDFSPHRMPVWNTPWSIRVRTTMEWASNVDLQSVQGAKGLIPKTVSPRQSVQRCKVPNSKNSLHTAECARCEVPNSKTHSTRQSVRSGNGLPGFSVQLRSNSS